MMDAPAPSPRRFHLRWLHLWLLGLLALPAIWVWLDPYTPQMQSALQHSPVFKAALPFIKPLGKLDKQLAGVLVVFLAGLALRRRAVKRWLWLTLACLLATGAVVNLTKISVRRERPKYEYHLVATQGLEGDASGNRYRSFPSADTASVFAIAFASGVFVPAAAIPLALAGCLVGLSRIAVGMHHPADVWAAMLMATGLSSLVHRWWDRRWPARAAAPCGCCVDAPQQKSEGS